jgi:hypothetical protein
VNAGINVTLDLGNQYPPGWIFAIPNSRYVNQFGDTYSTTEAGKNIPNFVFNNTVRTKLAEYYVHAITDIGTANIYAIRAGGGWYGELHYPDPAFNSHTNSYWAYDAIAQGQAAGLPPGVSTDPVPGWKPGTASTNHTSATAFAEWYLGSMKNYHDWQISTLRQVFGGKIIMMYPSWGVRPTQLASAEVADLNGTTRAETGGNLQTGVDYARFVGGLQDTNVIVYTTWLDSTNGDDVSTDPQNWNPVHYLASLAQPKDLQVWGESTGHGSYAAMQQAFNQMKAYHLVGVMWAFEPDLYSGQYATYAQYKQLIAQNP